MAISPPPQPQAARLSLINSMPVLDEAASSDENAAVQARWQDEYSFIPEACSDAHVADPCEPEIREPDPRPDVVDTKPFVVWAADRCRAQEYQVADYPARARRLLERCQSKQIAHELWEGTQAQASGWPNRFLAMSDADTVTTEPSGIVDTLACLEQALADCGCGSRGMIHATRQVVTHWTALGNSVLRREGGLLLTVHDTIVVSDAGYTGTGPNGEPAGSSVWAYATGIVAGRLSAIDIVPSPEMLADAMDRGINEVAFFAQREASVFWDACCHFAAEVDLATCAVGGVS